VREDDIVKNGIHHTGVSYIVIMTQGSQKNSFSMGRGEQLCDDFVEIEEAWGFLEVRDGILQKNELLRDQLSVLRDNYVSNYIWGYRFTLLRKLLLVSLK
jgi:hypothetical protein